ncbi:hypothetical protein BJQ94_11055 [Cryobacterium sp. SO2]|uniref:hypothetical protein n=1 Tax=Cryobacterium sp. SO2 TaxID=1897060 RepID=UPI00223D21B8|nr:hypothetical protein [Cryobacterium sp. SO2]WEO75918.1 hypothetical protein BJQ94_11055 [Cryobacterium sp. SO2]
MVDVPVGTQSDSRARAYIVDRLAPGTTIERRIEVQNNTEIDQAVRVYSGAAHIDGGVFTGEADPATNDITSWTSLDQPELELAPGESAMVLVTIAVPLDAAEGEQYAAVWAEVRAPSTDGSPIVQATRAGIRIYLSVGPGNGVAADFSVDQLTAGRDADGRPTLAAQVTNTGGRALDVTGDLTLADGPAGLAAGPFTVPQATTIAPGGSEKVLFTLDAELPNGPWDATLALKSGLVEREASATITFPDAGVGETVTPDAEVPVLWIAIGSVAVGLILVAGAVLLIRRRRIRAVRRTTAKTDPALTE